MLARRAHQLRAAGAAPCVGLVRFRSGIRAPVAFF